MYYVPLTPHTYASMHTHGRTHTQLTYSGQLLVFATTDPLECSLHFKLDILCRVCSLSKGQLPDGTGSHLCQRDIGVGEDAAQIVGKSAKTGDIAASLQTNQAHWEGRREGGRRREGGGWRKADGRGMEGGGRRERGRRREGGRRKEAEREVEGEEEKGERRERGGKKLEEEEGGR